jgi:Na+/proline symporter
MVSRKGSLLPGVLIGFIVILLLGSLPVLGPVIGGLISGQVARDGLRGGCMAGLLAGIFCAIVVSAIRILGVSHLFGVPGFFTMLG